MDFWLSEVIESIDKLIIETCSTAPKPYVDEAIKNIRFFRQQITRSGDLDLIEEWVSCIQMEFIKLHWKQSS
jgi:hypothetical protein